MRILILSLLLLGCSQPATSPNLSNEFFTRNYDRVIGLLSIKHQIDSARPIMLYYMEEYCPENLMFLLPQKELNISIARERRDVKEIIRELSQKYGLTEQAVSSMLFDFELILNNGL